MIALWLWLGCAHTVAHHDVGGVEVVTFRRAYSNAHLVRGPEGDILVDAGLEREAEALVRRLERAGVEPSELAAVVVTHGHADHAGGARHLQQAYGVTVVAGAGDVDALARGRNDELCATDRMATRRLEENQAERFEPLVPDTVVGAEDALELELLGTPMTVRALPGHTPGSLVVEVGEAVFVGDLIRGSLTGRQARTHFYQCDLGANRGDVQQLLDTVPAHTWFPGHFGPLRRDAVERWAENPR